MQATDFLSVFEWWFVLLAVGLGFFPLAWLIFHEFFDGGYAFSKIIGVVLLSYTFLFLGVVRLLPFTSVAVPGVFLLLSIGTLFLARRFSDLSVKRLRPYLFKFLFEELLFFFALLGWAYVRSFAPDIHGLEKYMDFGFINSILRSTYFPPKDMWLAPFTINYYYFGHLMTALLTKLSGIPSFVTFNLMIATLFALSVIECFSLGATLFMPVIKAYQKSKIGLGLAGLLSFLLVTLSGNLHVLYAFFLPYPNDNPVPPWKLHFAPLSFPNGYWYPNATRFIYHTIHEFPAYSWVVSDLHGHVLDIPIVLTALALIYLLLVHSLRSKARLHTLTFPFHVSLRFEDSFPYPLLLFISFFLAVMYMTNAWDGFIYFLLTALVIFAVTLYKTTGGPLFPRIFAAVGKAFLPAVIVGVGLICFSLPFSLFFHVDQITHGIGVICAPAGLTAIGKIGPFLFEPNHCQRSPWWQLLILYGFFYFFVVSFLAFLSRTRKLLAPDIFVLLLMLLATLLILIPEFFYVKDIYPTYYRANTMFKLVFQSFIMLSLASAYTVMRIVTTAGRIKKRFLPLFGFFVIITFILLVAVFSYPYFAVSSYYGDLAHSHGLNGIRYLETTYPDDYKGILWLNAHVSGQPVILEAQGDSYTDFARVSANTGLPTVLGWTVHEWLWRGSYGLPEGQTANAGKIYNVPEPRIPEVQNLYETSNLVLTKMLLTKYHIRYVFVGTLEYQKYPLLHDKKFAKFGRVVFESGTTKIYKITNL